MNVQVHNQRNRELLALSEQLGNRSITHWHMLDFFKREDAIAFAQLAYGELKFHVAVSESNDGLTWICHPLR